MKRLILTSSSGSGLAKSKLAEIVAFFFFRFTWGPLPSSKYFATYFEARSAKLKLGDHWSDWGVVWPRAFEDRRSLPLADFCEGYDEIELAADVLRQSGAANVAHGFYLRFVWGKLPSGEQLLMGLERRSAKHSNPGDHWLHDECLASLNGFGTRDIGFFELCAKFDSIDIWVDPLPNDQLVLVWLLDLLRPYKEITTKLSLVHTDDKVENYAPESVAKWKLPTFKVTDNHLVTASRAWRAYRDETPESCFDLLMTDLMILPRLRSALIAVLEELPDSVTGLGASEMDMLGCVNEGHTDPRYISEARWYRDVFDGGDAQKALVELAEHPVPPVLLGDPSFDNEDRYFGRSEWNVTLTELGRSLVAREDDMWRHNPIKRWWGGTELTNERLWRWDRESRLLVAP